MTTPIETVKNYWNAFCSQDYHKAGTYFSDNLEIIWPNTGEIFYNKKEFISVQENYPGIHQVVLEKISETPQEIITVVRVDSIINEQSLSFYAISFFQIKNNLIVRLTEYWSANESPPDWRNKEN